jgi:hypothetical protein
MLHGEGGHVGTLRLLGGACIVRAKAGKTGRVTVAGNQAHHREHDRKEENGRLTVRGCRAYSRTVEA